jgi:hypothetical protein
MDIEDEKKEIENIESHLPTKNSKICFISVVIYLNITRIFFIMHNRLGLIQNFDWYIINHD